MEASGQPHDLATLPRTIEPMVAPELVVDILEKREIS